MSAVVGYSETYTRNTFPWEEFPFCPRDDVLAELCCAAAVPAARASHRRGPRPPDDTDQEPTTGS